MRNKVTYLTYESDPDFWHLFLILIEFTGESGKIKGNRISFKELKVLLWRYHGKKTLQEIGKLVGNGVCRERISQIEKRALRVLNPLIKNRYNIF